MSVITLKAGKGSILSGYCPTVGEAVDNQLSTVRKDGKNRTTIIDICDICLKPTRVKRWMMNFRRKGWRFICSNCLDKKETYNLKEEKLFVGTASFDE